MNLQFFYFHFNHLNFFVIQTLIGNDFYAILTKLMYLKKNLPPRVEFADSELSASVSVSFREDKYASCSPSEEKQFDVLLEDEAESEILPFLRDNSALDVTTREKSERGAAPAGHEECQEV